MDEDKKKEIREIAKEVAAVVTEDLQSQFKVFGENLSGVRGKVDLLADDMDYVKSDIVDMKFEIKEMKTKLISVESEVKEINGKLDNKAEKEVVDGHENRIVRLENMPLPKAA